jgi:tetratricopeptide (TPR) repeat protein
MDILETIARAKALRREDNLDGSQALLLELAVEYPDDPLVLYETGGSYDVMGEEKQAIPYYEKAIARGLTGSDLQECLVCLGSSYRNVGKFEKAIETLERAVAEFPNKNSGKAFLALAYYSDGREDEAVSLLMDLLLKTTEDEDILSYARPLNYYKDNLDEVWGE